MRSDSQSPLRAHDSIVELEAATVGAHTELDQTGLEMACQRREAEAAGPAAHHPYRPIPGPGHPHDVLVAHRERAIAAELLERGELGGRDGIEICGDPVHEVVRSELTADDPCAVDAVHERPGSVAGLLHIVAVDVRRKVRRRVLQEGAGRLPPVDRGGAPEVAPSCEGHTTRPPRGGPETQWEGLPPWHASTSTHRDVHHALASNWPRPMTPNLPETVPLRSEHLYAASLASIALCITLWIRAKTIGEDARGNAERRAIFVGLWPPMLWLIGDTVRRRQERLARASGLLRAFRR